MSESLIQPFAKRIDNPILITFISIFVTYNWKFFYLILVPLNVGTLDKRLELALSELNSDSFDLFWFIELPVQAYIAGPVVLTTLSLLLLPIITLAYSQLPALINRKSEELESRHKALLQSAIFLNTNLERKKLQEIEANEREIERLRTSILESKQKMLSNLKTDDLYNSLSRPKEKKLLAEAIYSASKLVEVNDSYKNRVDKTIGIFKVKEDNIMLSDEAIAFLKNYVTEFPAELSN